jgi:hypothetical protein
LHPLIYIIFTHSHTHTHTCKVGLFSPPRPPGPSGISGTIDHAHAHGGKGKGFRGAVTAANGPGHGHGEGNGGDMIGGGGNSHAHAHGGVDCKAVGGSSFNAVGGTSAPAWKSPADRQDRCVYCQVTHAACRPKQTLMVHPYVGTDFSGRPMHMCSVCVHNWTLHRDCAKQSGSLVLKVFTAVCIVDIDVL